MTTHRHPDKHISASLQKAAEESWRIVKSSGNGHAWGRMYCPYGHPECAVSIYGTPRRPENHAKDLSRAVDRCPGPNELPEASMIRERFNHLRQIGK